MRVASTLSALLCVAILGAGCEAEDAPEGGEPLPGDTALPAAPDAVGGRPGDTLPPDDGQIRNVSATLTEWSVSLSQDSVPAGPIAFDVRNAGAVEHRFEVEGGGEEWETENIAPGGDVTMSVNLSPGTYEVYCPIEAGGVNHAERGMRTTLRVY